MPLRTPVWRRCKGAASALALVAGLYLISSYSYPLFHTIVEILSVVVAFAIFTVYWNSRHNLDSSYLTVVGIGLPFVAALDLLHALAHRDLGILPRADASTPNQLWLAARYLQAATLLAASHLTGRRLRPPFVFLAYFLSTWLMVTFVLHGHLFSVAYIPGTGLTLFNSASAYAVSLALVGAIFLLQRRRAQFDPQVHRLLLGSLLAAVVTELISTSYLDTYSLASLAGHITKVISFYLIYLALVQTSFVRPYDLLFRELKHSEEGARRERDLAEGLIASAPALVLLLDMEGRILLFNPALERASGRFFAEVRGRNWFTTMLPESDERTLQDVFDEAMAGRHDGSHVRAIITKSGAVRQIGWRYQPQYQDGRPVGMLAVGEDVTERLAAAAERERLVAELQRALSEVKTLSGLLPICASCKKIRDDSGYWAQIEEYLRAHSDAEFTHSLCPECVHKLYPDLFAEGELGPQGQH
ncbi:MAG: MASE3 domain-containing protein [Anaerolineae bacterium]